jgi:multicomponent Na+:H+ antiporter subunit F
VVFLYALIAFIALILVRILKGPTVWDRLMGMNLVTTKVIAVIILFAYLNDTTYLLDFAIVYALMGFISTIFIALFLSEKKIGRRRGKK